MGHGALSQSIKSIEDAIKTIEKKVKSDDYFKRYQVELAMGLSGQFLCSIRIK